MSELKKAYYFDLGNGFSKRKMAGSSTLTDPSLVALVEDTFQLNETNKLDVISVADRKVYIGKDVIESGQFPFPALGEMERYTKLEFKELLFGFIAKDFREEVTLPLLVLGLPVNHMKKKQAELKELATGKKVVKLNGKDILINIERTEVIAQPLGTYVHLLKTKKIEPNSHVLVVDGGFGTLDITELKGNQVVSFKGKELGMLKAFVEILAFLEQEYGDTGASAHNIADILRNGLNYYGGRVAIRELPAIQNILQKNFSQAYSFLEANYSVGRYDKVIFTGGMFLEHKERLQNLKENFIVLDDAQEANVNGYEAYGEALMASATGTI